MFNMISGGFGGTQGYGGGFPGFGGLQGGGGPNPQMLMQMREMVEQRRSEGLPTPFADQMQQRIQDSGFSPLQGMLTGIRSQNHGSFPGANLSQDQRNEIRNHIMNARADGQVTQAEKQQVFQTLQGFRQESGGGWAGNLFSGGSPFNGGGFPFAGGGGGFPFAGGGGPLQMMGGYGWT